jgi:hypothetical protein
MAIMGFVPASPQAAAIPGEFLPGGFVREEYAHESAGSSK